MPKFTLKQLVSNVPPEGTYKARCSPEVKVKYAGENAKNPGSGLLVFEWEIINSDVDVKKVFMQRSLVPAAIGFLGRDIEQSGAWAPEADEVTPDTEDVEEFADFMADLWGNKVFLIEIKHREYNGKTQADVSVVGPNSL